ncbi:unnamed protein product [Prunus armeniaca]
MAGSGSSEVRTPIFSSENYEFWKNLVEKGIPIYDSKKKKASEEISEEEDDEKATAILMKDAKALQSSYFPTNYKYRLCQSSLGAVVWRISWWRSR